MLYGTCCRQCQSGFGALQDPAAGYFPTDSSGMPVVTISASSGPDFKTMLEWATIVAGLYLAARQLKVI